MKPLDKKDKPAVVNVFVTCTFIFTFVTFRNFSDRVTQFLQIQKFRFLDVLQGMFGDVCRNRKRFFCVLAIFNRTWCKVAEKNPLGNTRLLQLTKGISETLIRRCHLLHLDNIFPSGICDTDYLLFGTLLKLTEKNIYSHYRSMLIFCLSLCPSVFN